jgi:hypothetical protein
MKVIAAGEAWGFARMDEFWAHYRCLTPWGKDEAGAQTVFADPDELEKRYDDIDEALAWIRGSSSDPSTPDRLSYHLKRMPRVPLAAKDSYELVELFQVKKFIANHRGTIAASGTRIVECFNLDAGSDGSALGVLAAELGRGGSDPESLYLADAYDAGLAEARAGIAAEAAILEAERSRAETAAAEEFGISFDGREFVVAPEDAALAMAGLGGRYSVEPYDDTRFVVRIMPSPAALEAMGRLEGFREAERLAEERVIAGLSALVRDAMPELRLAVAAVARWDRARAGAVMAMEYRMSRPVLDVRDMVLETARFIPCEEECLHLGLAYTPLCAHFEKNAVVLFGSNMGGKTVVLQTILFFQMVAQSGLFVPAGRFGTRVYDRIEYVGERAGERLAGLSGFGLEVWRLGNAWSPAAVSGNGGTLAVFDELARTTGSHEAEALLSAVVEAYTGTTGRAFFATHFRGIARVAGAEYLKMRGLDTVAVESALLATARPGPPNDNQVGDDNEVGDKHLAARLAGINKFMRYEVIDDDGAPSDSDALAIASMLGLDENIISRARWFLTKGGV